MTVSSSIPATVQMRRSRLVGLLAIVAIVATAITWAAFAATESGSGTVGNPAAASDIPNPAAQYGRGLSQVGSFFRTTASRDLQLTPSEKRYVQGIASLSRVEQAAAFGGHGGVIDALGLSPREAAYVKAIVSLTPAQIAAGFGTSR
jgi:hypothetical protein